MAQYEYYDLRDIGVHQILQHSFCLMMQTLQLVFSLLHAGPSSRESAWEGKGHLNIAPAAPAKAARSMGDQGTLLIF